MTHEDYERAAKHWEKRDIDNIRMDKEQLVKVMEEYIQSKDTCALATGTSEFVRCTPIEYVYYEKALWMFSEGGEKFISLEKNKNVCVAIFDPYQGFGKLKGMQITGTARMVEPFSDEYKQLAQVKKIPISALEKLPEPMNLICIRPTKIEFLNSEFKSQGYSNRQMVEFK